MAKRIYISRIVGTGAFTDPFDLSVAKLFQTLGLPGRVSKVMPTTVQAGGWGLAIVATPNHTQLLADPDSDAFPDVALDIKLSSIKPQTWNAIVTRASLRGIDLSAFSTSGNSADAVRDVIRHLGNLRQPGFSENNFDAADVG